MAYGYWQYEGIEFCREFQTDYWKKLLDVSLVEFGPRRRVELKIENIIVHHAEGQAEFPPHERLPPVERSIYRDVKNIFKMATPEQAAQQRKANLEYCISNPRKPFTEEEREEIRRSLR